MFSAPRTPLAGWRDLVLLGAFAAGFLLTLIVPRKLDSRFVERLAALFVFLRKPAVYRLALQMQQILPGVGTEDSKKLAREHYCLRTELWWGRFRSLRRGGWRPEVVLRGESRLRAALKAGKGAILWRMWFCENPVTLQALARAGFSTVHLSAETHGAPAASQVGLRWTAPLYVRAEEPYVAKRVVIPRDGSLGYMRELVSQLQQNACVSIVGENRGRRNVAADFFGRRVEFALGAPSLAHRTGAALLTAYSVRRGVFHYEVIIDDPVDIDRTLDRRRFNESAVEEFASRLQKRVAEHPVEWQGWLRRTFPIDGDNE